MATRLFNDNHEWSPKAEELDNYIKAALQKWVSANPGLDPRDVQLVATEAVGDFTRWVIVREMIQSAKAPGFDPDDDGDDE
jgi:hypothetical protein